VKIISYICVLLLFNACAKVDEDLFQETSADQVGDVMVAIDNMGGASNSYTFKAGKNNYKMIADTAKSPLRFFNSLFPKAYATSCGLAGTFGSCTNNVIVNDLEGCSVGDATVSGNITLTYDDGTTDNTCGIDSDGDTISRDPHFTVSGLHGGTYTVSKSGSYGQRITRTSAAVYTFASDGIRRVLDIAGTTVGDFTTSTTTALGIAGSQRSGRVLNGGTLHVVNNSSGNTCDFSPTNVTWNSSCVCPVSGSWSASCSDGKTGTLTITSCGEASYTFDGDTSNFSFDRCSGF
jgi:hypothetical protein